MERKARPMYEHEARLALELSGFTLRNRKDLMLLASQNNMIPVGFDEEGGQLFDPDDVERVAQGGTFHPKGKHKSLYTASNGPDVERGRFPAELPRDYGEGFEMPPGDPSDYPFRDYGWELDQGEEY